MSVHNPYLPEYGWKIDPDHRQDRSSGPCTTKKMTEEEKVKYGITAGESEDTNMAIMTKELVKQMRDGGMTTDQIAKQFESSYPKMKPNMVKAKITMLLSDKKSGKPAKEHLPESELPPVEAEEYPDIKEAAAEVGKQVSKEAADSIDRMKLASVVDEMLELVSETDVINHPAHYTTGKIEVIDYLQDKLPADMFEGFCVGNALKYLSRYRFKGGVADLKKAVWYLNRIIGVKETA